MAGSIFVSKQLRLPLSTQQFDYLVERIRIEYGQADQARMQAIFSPLDEEGMNFISAESQDDAGFKAFFDAIVRAKERSSLRSEDAPFVALWDELLDKVRLDSRFSADWVRNGS